MIESDRDKARAAAKSWRARNAEKVRASKLAYYQKTKEKEKERRRARYAADPEYFRSRSREYHRRKKAEISEHLKKKRIEHPEKFQRNRQLFWERNRAAMMVHRSRRSAKNKGLAFDLDREWFLARLNAGVCEATGISFDMNGKRTPTSPSVDRIDPKGGYTKDNCRLIIWWLNRALCDQGEEFALRVFMLMAARKPWKAAA